jgi:hypothetical protein
MRITLALTFAALVVAPACKKKDDSGAATKTTETKTDTTAAKPEAEKAAETAVDKPANPLTMDAPALFDDYNKPNQDAMALMEKWRPGVVVTGVVTQVITEEAGNSSVWLDGGNNHKISLGFKDDGKAAKDKGVKKDDKIMAQCQIGGSDGNLMMLTDCELK